MWSEKKIVINVLLKQPIKGFAKTRLAVRIGEDEALLVYKRLLEKTAKMLHHLQKQYPNILVHLHYTPEIAKGDQFNELSCEKFVQIEGALGQRMAHINKSSIAQGFSKVFTIGTDCYHLDAKHFVEAIKLLDKHDVVFGPAKDGGYYLLGIKRFDPSLFENITWSTSKVMAQSLGKVSRLGLSAALLEPLSDIDTFDDLIKVPELGHYTCRD